MPYRSELEAARRIIEQLELDVAELIRERDGLKESLRSKESCQMLEEDLRAADLSSRLARRLSTTKQEMLTVRHEIRNTLRCMRCFVFCLAGVIVTSAVLNLFLWRN